MSQLDNHCLLYSESESEVTQSCPTLQWTATYQAPSMGFSRQEYWSGVPLPSPIVFRSQEYKMET